MCRVSQGKGRRRGRRLKKEVEMWEGVGQREELKGSRQWREQWRRRNRSRKRRKQRSRKEEEAQEKKGN